jgi:hypothetical protein
MCYKKAKLKWPEDGLRIGNYLTRKDYRSKNKWLWSMGKHSRYYKIQSRKAFRRFKGEVISGGFYKKTYDYWWKIV